MKKILTGAMAAGLALAAVAAAPAVSTASGPTPAETAVAVDGTTVTVTGSLAEDLARTAIVDDAGDGVPTTGHDITEYSISFPEAGQVAFHLAIDENPGTGFAPALTQYAINPTIGSTALELTAEATVLTPGQLEFASQSCVEGPGGNTCTPSPVDGEYADGVITWFIDTNALPGTQVSGGQAEVNPYFEVVWFVNGLIDVATGSATNMPSARLIVDGETLDWGALSNDEGFTVSADLAPGTYEDVAVKLCTTDFGDAFNECTTVELDPITVGEADAS